MSDELIDILLDDLSFQKTSLKSDAHKYGWLHASVHIWFYTKNGKILLQKRSPNKLSFPNLWDVSVAGHISAGEKPTTSALREIKEEIGITVKDTDLVYIGKYHEIYEHKKNYVDNEIHYIYLCELTHTLDSLKIQEEELSDIKLIAIDDFKKLIYAGSNENEIVPHEVDYYALILEHIEAIYS